MRHRISDYTPSDLAVARSSPFNSASRQAELEFEYLKRKQRDRDKVEAYTGYIPTTSRPI